VTKPPAALADRRVQRRWRAAEALISHEVDRPMLAGGTRSDDRRHVPASTIPEEYDDAYAAQAAATRMPTPRAAGPGTPRPRAARRSRGGRLVDAAADPGAGDTGGPGRRSRSRRTTPRINAHTLRIVALPRHIDTLAAPRTPTDVYSVWSHAAPRRLLFLLFAHPTKARRATRDCAVTRSVA
jgi:hypothetical protein